MTPQTMTVGDLANQRNQDKCAFLDVRTPGEYRELHIPGSVNIPLADLKRFKSELSDMASDKEVLLVCRTGRRAHEAKRCLSQAGIDNTVVLEGGLESWVAEGKEATKGKRGMSIERQVRIAAGSLVLIGIALGSLLHPGFYGLSAFVGAGLVFAGITDTCGMAMVLGRLPCNRV